MIDLRIAEKVVNEIKSSLLNNEKIRKLLYYDTSDALKISTIPTISDTDKYIVKIPLLEYAIKEYNMNSFIMVTLPALIFEDGNIDYNIAISCITTFDVANLDSGSTRVIELCNEIISEVENVKFSGSLKLVVDSMKEILVEDKAYGYVININTSDLLYEGE